MIGLEKIVNLVKDGASDKDIARFLHCDVGQAIKIRKKLNRSRSVLSKDVYSRMLECGLGDSEVAYVFGMTRTELENWKVRESIKEIVTY